MGFFDRVTEMSWVTPGIDEERQSYTFSRLSVKRVALTLFLAVITSMFLLFSVAYFERMELGDWRPVAEPFVLWINSAVLVAASFAMQFARNRAAAGASPRRWLELAGLLAIVFLAGQLMAWKQLADLGVYSLANPAYAFFLLLTALHGLHFLGGLYVWARTAWRERHGASAEAVAPTIELCAIYWHFLLLVWVVLFVLMLAN